MIPCNGILNNFRKNRNNQQTHYPISGMKIINFGSLNIDHVYKVEHFVRPGETIPSITYQQHCGGKGLNQSIALARAGANVYHYGKIGTEGNHLPEKLQESGVNIQFVSTVAGPTGHAIIQVSATGENAIIIEGGANQSMDSSDISTILAHLSEGDWLLLQNEVNGIGEILKAAEDHPCKVAFNPAPLTGVIASLPLDRVDLMIVNETEGSGLTGRKEADHIITELVESYPHIQIVLTMGAQGAVYADRTNRLKQAGFTVEPVDTTAAGDTFVGYFIAALSQGASEEEALAHACRAASICVTRAGAADSIPHRSEVAALLPSARA